MRYTVALCTPFPRSLSPRYPDTLSQYQYTFEEKTDWSAYYAPGHEILGYIESVVAKYKLMPYIHLRHELVSARYDEPTGKWHVRIRRPLQPDAEGNSSADAFEEVEDTADMFFTGVGGLSRWKWPDIDGLKSFGGTIVHSAGWEIPRPASTAATVEDGRLKAGWEEDVKDWGDKRVAVIGVVRAGLDSSSRCLLTTCAVCL